MTQTNANATQPPTTRFLDRPHGRIAYDVTGEGPLVVAAPGMGDLRSAYRMLAPALVEAGYRVATMDLRGHGESDTTFGAFDGEAAGTDIIALLEDLGGGPAVVIGNSMTAGSAVMAAAERPDLVAGLVLTGPFVRDPSGGRLAELSLRVMLTRPWGPRVWNTYYAKLYPGRQPEDLQAHRDHIRQNLREPGRWNAFIQTTRTRHAYAEARLDDVQAPVLVVMGDSDPDWSDAAAEAEYIGQRLDGQVLMVEHAGHYPHVEYPEVVTPRITSFLAEEARWTRSERQAQDGHEPEVTPDA